MAIRTHRSLLKCIEESPGGIALQVQKASDAGAAETALREARAEIANLDGGWQSAPGLSAGDTNGPKYLSSVTQSPSGPFLYVDGGYTPTSLLATIPDIVARHLVEAGVKHAVISTPSQDGPHAYTLYEEGQRAVVLRLYPRPPPLAPLGQRQRLGRIPDHWYDEAVDWVRGDLGDDAMLWGAAGPVGFPVPASQGRAHFERTRRAPYCLLMSGEMGSRLRAADPARPTSHQTLALGGGGPEASDEELVALATALVEVARRLATDLSYAHVDMYPTFAGLMSSWQLPDPGRSNPETFETTAGTHSVQEMCDEIALDGFGYQIVSEGHRARLGDRLDGPPGPVSVRDLGGGRCEVAVGPMSSWLYDHPERHDLQLAARRFLAPCLLTGKQARALFFEKRGIEDPLVVYAREHPPPPEPAPADDEGEPMYVIRVLPIIVPTYRRVVAGAETTYEAGVLPQPIGPLELRLEFGDGTSATSTVEPGPDVVTVAFTKTFSSPGRYMQRLETSQPKTIIDGEVNRAVSEATTDVDPPQ